MADTKVNQFFSLSKRCITTYISISIAVFLFILFFQPFSITPVIFENKLLLIAGFGLITFLSLFILQIIFHDLLIENEVDKPENYLWYSIYLFSLVALTSLSFIFYSRYVGNTKTTFIIVLRIIIICSGIPAIIMVRHSISSLQLKNKKLLAETRSLQEHLNKFSENYSNKSIELISSNDSDNFRVSVAEIVYLKSADNYVEVGYFDGKEIRKRMIRNTLKNVEQQLKEFNNFIRTHRTCIVNIQFIEKLNKNFNSYWLSLSECTVTIPVSRQYLLSVKDLF